MTQTITMTPKEVSRYGIIQRLLKKEINGTEVAKQIGVTVRQIRNLKAKVKQYGVKGIVHGNRGKLGNRRITSEKVEIIERIVKQRYPDFGPTLAAEKLGEEHGIKIAQRR